MVDLTEWYHACYNNPYESVQDCIARLHDRWQSHADTLGMTCSLQRGAQPKCSLETLFVLSTDLCSSRTTKRVVLKALLLPLAQLWSSCCQTGNLGCTGRLDCPSSVEQAESVDSLLALTLPVELHGKVSNMLRVFNDNSLPAAGLALARCAALWPYYRGEYLAAAASVGRKLMGAVEQKLLNEPTLLCADRPAEADQHYSYRCGRSWTRQDPRTKAGHQKPITRL